jgi:phospholipid transport system substrate-binding protein
MQNYKNYFTALLLSFFMTLAFAESYGGEGGEQDVIYDPKYLIEDVIYDVIRAIRRDRERYEDNREEVNKLVKEKIMPHVDVIKMSTLILGRHKSQFTEEQFTEFIYLFESITIHSYAMYILDYKDSYSLSFRATRFNDRLKIATVHMILKLEQNRKVDTQFALYYNKNNDTWKIFNLAFEGINYGLVYRNSYNEIIKNHGVDALLEQLREKLK